MSGFFPSEAYFNSPGANRDYRKANRDNMRQTRLQDAQDAKNGIYFFADAFFFSFFLFYSYCMEA